MFRSIRVRLTLWYLVFFGGLLIAFSVYLYSSWARDLRKRFDFSLLRTADAMASYFTHFANQQDVVPGAQEAVRELKLGRLSTAICRDEHLLASNGQDIVAVLSSSKIRPLLKRRNQLPLFTEPLRGKRLVIVPFQVQGTWYAVAVLEPMDHLIAELARLRDIILFALPAALALAAAGGFFLAGMSLKPMVAISEQAAHISARNLSERLNVESNDELGRLAGVFNALLSRLDHSFRIMREFMADAAHELRTPLAIIHGEADVSLSRPRTHEEYKESLGVIRGNCKRVVRIVDDMLALARADSGAQPLRLDELYFNEVIEGCCRSAQALATVKGVRLTYETDDDISFYGDEELLKRMTVNLVDNAIRYTPAGGSVSVKTNREDSNARLVVSDTGIGIPPDSIRRVFDRFYCVNKSRARADGGSGLGLSIVKLAAEAHRGTVEVVSEVGRGSTFTVSLPLVNG